MTRYISLLRGINVSGHNKIKMEALRECYAEKGLTEIKSYVQSGNVIFSSSELEPSLLSEMISQHIEYIFGFSVKVIVLTREKLNDIIRNNPFLNDATKDPMLTYVTFLSGSPVDYDISKLNSKRQEGEEVVITDDAAYLYCPSGYGRTKLSNTFLENGLKVAATTRNWNTVTELYRMAAAT